SVQLSAQGEDYDSLIWITQGDGTFENPQNAETTYYPGPEDEEEMQVLLYAEAINTDACDTTVSDSLMVTFEEAPQVETDSLQAACANDSVIEISGTAEYYSEAQWSTEGSGQFSDASSLNTNYLPSQEDINSGEVSLFLNVSSTGGCQSEDTDTLILDFVPVPFASAGDNISTCEGSSVTLSGEVANSSDFYWQTLGDGIFENSSNLNTIYTPGENDIETENAIIQLIAEPLSPCNDNAVDNLTITIDPAVTVNIEPEEDTIYAGDEYELTAYAENNSALEWEVIGGEGDIEPVDQSTTTYYSVEQDTLNSPVTLEVTAYPAGSCESNATDQLLLYVIPPPEINAGEDIETCVTTDEVMVNGSSELNTSFTWTTSGEGEFENPNELQTTYFPHENDITNGEVTLTLSEDNNPEILNDSLTVFFHDLPTCELEEDTAGICGDDSLFLAPEISNATTVEWNTSGDGTFSDTTSVETTYFPGNNDIDNGSVILYATAYSDYCPDTTASDSIIVNIEPAPIANAGADSTVCSNINMVLLSDAEAFDYDSVNWSSSGTGNFNDETLVNAQYYPSAEDKSSGQVTLTLTALGQEYCSDEDDDSRTFFFSETPSVTIPGEYSACESSFVEVEALASDAASIEWYTEGDGTFTDSLGVTAVYQAGDEDITNGEAMLYAVASGMAECSNVTDTAFTLLGVFSEPTVDAGNDTVTCNDSHLLNGEATDFSEIQWSTSGTGYFENPNLLQTFYYPSEQDFEEGQVTLTLAADPISPCTEETSDTLVLTLQSTPPPPSQPQGEQTVCYEANTQTQTQYSTDPVEEANQYIWTISPPARGEFAQSITNEPQNTVTWGEATGSFTINVKAENNCGTSDYSEGLDGNYLQADVEIEASPDSIACFSQNIELNAISSEGSYIWYPGGFTGQTIIVDTSMFDGNEETYEVEFTDINGCTATDNINVMFTPCTSAPSPQQEKQPVITPNPARKYIKIKYHKKARMELLNSNGQNLKTFHHHFSNNSEKKISLSNLPTGIYIIKIQNTKTTYIHKFVHIR
ncbi:MAG: T9SS type A sorting domain-containing protein, partial [Bacteroidales bacterium]|nr:T9SS type A sorting domain-containing protein [Bacteroidales bacterium]